MRLIDADALLGSLGINKPGDCKACEYDGFHDVCQCGDDFCYAISKAPTIKPEWIPCSERLPEKKQKYVLVTVMDNTPRKESERYFVDIASLINGDAWFPDSADWSSVIGKSGEKHTVLAWSPLPEPYKPSC